MSNKDQNFVQCFAVLVPKLSLSCWPKKVTQIGSRIYWKQKKLPATNGFIPYVCYWFYGGVNLWNCRSIFGHRTPDRTCWVGSVAVAATPVTRLMIFKCLTGAETVTATVMSSRMDAEFVILHAVTCGRRERVGVFSSVWVAMSQHFLVNWWLIWLKLWQNIEEYFLFDIESFGYSNTVK